MTSLNTHHVAGVSFSDDHLELRETTLGASDVPAVLGFDRYRSPLDVFLNKRGLAEPFAGNEHTEWGLRVEPVIRQKVADTLGVSIELPGTLVHPKESWMSATPDGVFDVDGVSSVLEIKNKSERQAVYWGVSGTDQIPTDVAAQVYWQLLVTGLENASVAVLFGKSDFRLYHLHVDHTLAADVLEPCRTFWMSNVCANIAPALDGSERTAEFLKAKFAAHTDALRDATREEDQWIKELGEIRERIKSAEQVEQALKNKLMAAIGGDAGVVGRNGRVTWKAPAGFTVKWKEVAEALNAPSDLIAQFSTPQSRKFLPTFPK